MDSCRCKQWLCQQSWCIHRQERRQHRKRTWGICSKVANCCSTSLVSSYLLWQFLFFCKPTACLLWSGLYGCGTLGTNRKGCPQELQKKTKKGLQNRGDYITYQHNSLTVSLWQDNKPVVVIATNSDFTSTESVPRKQWDGSTQLFPCPTSVFLYNKYMGGINTNDQLNGYYHVKLKCRKYYKYIFWWLGNHQQLHTVQTLH